MRSVLVTGASGFIGRMVLKHLRIHDFKVHVAHRNAAAYADDVTSHLVDLLDCRESRKLIEAIRPTHLLHLAWDVTPGQFWQAQNNLDWVAASLALYRAFVDVGGKRAVFTGTCAEYDWGSSWLDETTSPRKPHTLYGIAKNALFDLITAADKPNMSFAWARLFYLYGPGEPPGRLVSDVMSSLVKGMQIPCTPGLQERDFLHVDDVARALAIILASNHYGPVNIASGDCRPVREIVELIGILAGKPELICLGAKPAPTNEPLRLAGNVSILRNLGFKPRYNLQDGLRQTWSWWKESQSSQNQIRTQPKAD